MAWLWTFTSFSCNLCVHWIDIKFSRGGIDKNLIQTSGSQGYHFIKKRITVTPTARERWFVSFTMVIIEMAPLLQATAFWQGLLISAAGQLSWMPN